MAMTWRNQYDTMPEELIDLRTIEDVQNLQRELVAFGVSPTVARNLPGWIMQRRAGLDDSTAPSTRSRYRKILASVIENRPDGPGRRRSDERGYARLGVVAGVGIAAGAVLSGGHPVVLASLAYLTEHGYTGDDAETVELVAA